MLRGLRTTSDMENEFTMSLMNLNLDPEIETVFLMAKESLLARQQHAAAADRHVRRQPREVPAAGRQGRPHRSCPRTGEGLITPRTPDRIPLRWPRF